jgi:WhiB family transcriptional regulator, redox-sensing transcriptional regulator
MTAVFAAPARRRIRPRSSELEWHEEARCTSTDPDAFFPEVGEDARPAKAICRACPSREACLLFSLTSPVAEWGTWGGFSERDRRSVARDYRAGWSLADIIADDDARFYDVEEATCERQLASEREGRRTKRDAIAVPAPATRPRKKVAA